MRTIALSLILILAASNLFAYVPDTEINIDIAYFYELKEKYQEDLQRINYIIEVYEQRKGVINAEGEDKLDRQQEEEIQ